MELRASLVWQVYSDVTTCNSVSTWKAPRPCRISAQHDTRSGFAGAIVLWRHYGGSSLKTRGVHS